MGYGRPFAQSPKRKQVLFKQQQPLVIVPSSRSSDARGCSLLRRAAAPRLMRSSKMTWSDSTRAPSGCAGALPVRVTSTCPPAEPPLLVPGSGLGSACARAANDGSDAALWNADGTLGGATCAARLLRAPFPPSCPLSFPDASHRLAPSHVIKARETITSAGFTRKACRGSGVLSDKTLATRFLFPAACACQQVVLPETLITNPTPCDTGRQRAPPCPPAAGSWSRAAAAPPRSAPAAAQTSRRWSP